ncbi:MAG TPA: cell division topological specificity factor MinE [Ktedonobacterales bacterium]
MGFFDKLFGRNKPAAPSAGEMARERLTLMLVHDRLKLTPDLLDRIKEELLAVISKYVEIDETGVDVELTHSEHSDKLVARMPVRRQRLQFQRDVLEPGMGNPLAAAAALADIHQPPSRAADAPAEAPPSSAPPEAVPEAAQTPAEGPSAEPANAAPEPAAAEAMPLPSEEGQVVKEENTPTKAEEVDSAPTEDKSAQASESSAAETSPAAEAVAENTSPETNASPAPAAEEAPAPEVPASATTTTNG